MASYNKFHQFVEDLASGVHNFSSHKCKVVLTLASPASSNSVLADLTQATASNGYTSGGLTASIIDSSQSNGLYKLTLEDVSFTASGGDMPLFRYVSLYNDTPTSPADPLIAYWDYGSTVNITSGNSFTIDFPTTASGIFQLS